MPKGPKGEKRPADVIGAAVMVGKIATGEIEGVPVDDGKDKAAQAMGRKGGKAPRWRSTSCITTSAAFTRALKSVRRWPLVFLKRSGASTIFLSAWTRTRRRSSLPSAAPTKSAVLKIQTETLPCDGAVFGFEKPVLKCPYSECGSPL